MALNGLYLLVSCCKKMSGLQRISMLQLLRNIQVFIFSIVSLKKISFENKLFPFQIYLFKGCPHATKTFSIHKTIFVKSSISRDLKTILEKDFFGRSYSVKQMLLIYEFLFYRSQFHEIHAFKVRFLVKIKRSIFYDLKSKPIFENILFRQLSMVR